MLLGLIIYLLVSNAVTLRRDKSILYSRISITILILCILISVNSFYTTLYSGSISVGLLGSVCFLLINTITKYGSYFIEVLRNYASNLSYNLGINFLGKNARSFTHIASSPLVVGLILLLNGFYCRKLWKGNHDFTILLYIGCL